MIELRRIANHLSSILAGFGAKVSDPPRPTTGVDRVKRRAARAQHRHLVSILIPDSPTLEEE